MGKWSELSESERYEASSRVAERIAKKLYPAGEAGLARSVIQRGMFNINAELMDAGLAFLRNAGLIDVRPPRLQPRGWGLNKPGRVPTVYAWASTATPAFLWPKDEPQLEAEPLAPKPPTIAERLDKMEATCVRIEAMLVELTNRAPAP
jgi:hypothetical protein